jgi:prevent-host-death family protein
MYTVREAQTKFSELLRKAARGEEVVIARGKTPVAKLVAIREPLKGKKKRVPGRLKGEIRYTADAFEPMSPEELAEWGIE